jgi:hypothetical protein
LEGNLARGSSVSRIYDDKGHGHDVKYSQWRRSYPNTKGIRNLYCTDIDWLEWRNGKPVALVEVSRTLGTSRPEEVVKRFTENNYGFQAEALAFVAMKLEVPAFLVVIDEPHSTSQTNYTSATFYVTKINPILPWPKGRGKKFTDEPLAVYTTEGSYFNDFISLLPNPTIPPT